MKILIKNCETHLEIDGQMLFGKFIIVVLPPPPEEVGMAYRVRKTIVSSSHLTEEEIDAAIDRMATENAKRIFKIAQAELLNPDAPGVSGTIEFNEGEE